MKTGAAIRPPERTLFDRARESGLSSALKERIEAGLTKRRTRRRKALRTGAAVLLVCLTALLAVPYFKDTARYSTAAAHRQKLLLADGSHAELNAQTELATDFRYGRRSVILEKGEAYFTVAPDPTRPFTVRTPSGTIVVTGTQFNVRAGEGATEVILAEGSVAFTAPNSAPISLEPGQQLRNSSIVRLRRDELDNLLAWRRGQLVLDNLSIAEASGHMSRYHGAAIEVSPELSLLRLGGTCQLDDLPGFLDGLRQLSGVQVVTRGPGVHAVLPRRE
jgi:transmembrane sensor